MDTADIKTYHAPPLENIDSFSIRRMENIYEAHNGQQDAPHRHEYYTIVFTQKADGIHVIDFNEFELGDSQVHFISPGQVHQIKESKKPLGWAITFSEDFLIENHIDNQFISDINLFTDYGYSPPLEVNEETWQKLDEFCQRMDEVQNQNIHFKYQTLGAYLKLFLIGCNQACTSPALHSPHEQQAGSTLLRRFKHEVETHFNQEHSVSFYAKQLMVTADHLNKTVKALVGKTAKEYIQTRLTTEAKRLLIFSQLSTKEIGFELGFSDAPHFSHFFKKCTGQSPSEFRKATHH